MNKNFSKKRKIENVSIKEKRKRNIQKNKKRGKLPADKKIVEQNIFEKVFGIKDAEDVLFTFIKGCISGDIRNDFYNTLVITADDPQLFGCINLLSLAIPSVIHDYDFADKFMPLTLKNYFKIFGEDHKIHHLHNFEFKHVIPIGTGQAELRKFPSGIVVCMSKKMYDEAIKEYKFKLWIFHRHLHLTGAFVTPSAESLKELTDKLRS